ncbi:hypothetical protein CVS37_36495 [Burkholderia lata]|nr:hypothetical protein CVS37_36495 [Burkholderia lata]
MHVIHRLQVLRNVIEVAVARVDWSETVRAAETRLVLLMTLAPDQPDEAHTAIRVMREIDIRISIATREALQTRVTGGRKALHETRCVAQALTAQPPLPGAEAVASRSRSWPA